MVSATAAMKKIMKEGARTITFQAGRLSALPKKVRLPDWAATISESLREPVKRTTGTSDRPIAAS